MTLTTEKNQPPPHKNKLAVRWMFIILFISLLFTARWVTPAYGSYASIRENSAITPSVTPTATATRSGEPAATGTPAPYLIQGTTVKVSGSLVSLRTGPGFNFELVRKVTFGESLMLLGRSSDNYWLYIKTSDGQDGWIQTIWVDLAQANLDYFPIQTPPQPPDLLVKVTGSKVNLRSGPGFNYEAVRQLAYGESLVLLGRVRDNSWLYIKTSDGQDGWIETGWVVISWSKVNNDYHPIQTPPPTPTSTPVILEGVEGRWIDVDLSEQRLFAYEGTERVGSFLVSTGIAKYPTEVGQYKIYVKMRYSLMHGDDYFLPDVPYTMYYSGDFSIHGTYWHHNFGHPMSHGCINMDTSDAEWLFGWASVGTLVNIHH